MTCIKQEKIMEIGSAALRCGRYAMTIKDKRSPGKRVLGYHEGKLYAYSWVLLQLGLAELLDHRHVYQLGTFLKTYRKGKVILYPGLKWKFLILIDRKTFEDILAHMLPVHGIETTDGVRKLCKVI